MSYIDQMIQYLIKFSPQFSFLYVSGIIFFFYLRSRKMRNIYKDIKNYTKYGLINRKIKLKGALVLSILFYWFAIVYEPIRFTDGVTTLAYGANAVGSGVVYFVFFVVGSQTGLWLSDDDDFGSTN